MEKPLSTRLPKFDQREVQEFLSQRHIAKIGTIGTDGFPHVAPIWFIHENEQILMCTNDETVKIRNLRKNKNVCVLVDAAVGGLKIRGAMFQGHAEIIAGEEARKINRRIHVKYMGEDGLKDSRVSSYLAQDTVTIKLAPKKTAYWDYFKIDFSEVPGMPLWPKG